MLLLRREVEHVVLVDLRRHEQHRYGVHTFGLRLVLDQLEDVGAQHDRPRCGRQVARRPRTWSCRQSRAAAAAAKDRAARRRPPCTKLAPPVFDGLLDRCRVRPREVGRRERVQHVARSEPRAALGAPVDLCVRDQPVDCLADRPGSPGADDGTAQLASHAGSANRRSPFAGASSERPAATRPSSRARPAVRVNTLRGRRARPAPIFTPDPGARNLGGPPAAASASITSRLERAAWPVRPRRDWLLSATLALLLIVPPGCLMHRLPPLPPTRAKSHLQPERVRAEALD